MTFFQYGIIAVLFFFCVNHFAGIDQDCTLYTLQAINRIFPERFIGDPAFMFGNQDLYSLYSPLYCLFIKVLPIDTAAFTIGIMIHGLFAFSVSLMLWKWTKSFQCRFLLPITLCFFALYAYGEARNEFIFSLKTIEPYPVPRTLSAALGFWGLAYFFEKKWISLTFFFLGTLIHPLTAGWCLPLWILFHLSQMRIPIIILSALFPLTIFIGEEPWAVCPDEWIRISLKDGLGEQVRNMVLFLVFFVAALKKTNLPQTLKQFLTYFNFVLGIAFYWFVIALSTHHIFLYQVQAFRIQWICQILALFTSAWYLNQIYISKILAKQRIDIWEKLLLGLLFVLWFDCAYFITFAASAFLCFKVRNVRHFKTVGTGILFLCVIGSIFVCHSILGFNPCIKPEYVYADKLFYLNPFIAILSALILCLAVYFSKYRFAASVLLTIISFLIMYAWRIFPKENFSIAYVMGTLVFIVVFLQWNCNKTRCTVSILVTFIMATSAFLFYDCRDEQRKMREKAINQFVQAPPFPSISNRGKILFSVQNFGEEIPRLRFLSGGYYDFQMIVGSVFFKQQRREVEHREWFLYSGEQTMDSTWINLSGMEKFQKCWEVVNNEEVLPKKFQQLCNLREVSHLVSDKKLPLVVEDSLILWYNNETIWLYPCPPK